jgi:hypothetical protein
MTKSSNAAQPTFDPRLRYDIPESVSLLRKSRAAVYSDIKSGRIKVIRDGRRVYIPGSEIARLSALPGAA